MSIIPIRVPLAPVRAVDELSRRIAERRAQRALLRAVRRWTSDARP